MKTTTKTFLNSILKKHLHSYLCSILFALVLLAPQSGLSQSDADKAILSVVTKYTSSIADRTDVFLNEIGYNPPTYLKNEWKSYPAIRKLSMAYEAAEVVEPGIGGKKLIQKLKYKLSRKYEGIRYEPILKNLKSYTGKITFKHPTKYGNIKLDNGIKRQLLTLSKYTERGALGGSRGVLLFKFGLHDIDVFDILAKSDNPYTALERGLSKSKIPPTHQERLKNIIRDLQTKYEGARYEVEFKKYNDGLTFSSEKTYTPKKIQNPPNNGLTKAKYNRYIVQNYKITGIGLKFQNMIRFRRGFGGVIFGNTVKDSTQLPKLSYINYIPTDTKITNEPMGTLEFIFEDGTVLTEPSVFAEDIIAAHQLIFNNTNIDDNGIGLAGIHSRVLLPNGLNRSEVVIHPALANFKLGWAAVLSDIFPLVQSKLVHEVLENGTYEEYVIVKKFFTKEKETYKIIDVPLTATRTENELQLYRNDLKKSQRIQDSYITMHEFEKNDTIGKESLSFYQATPIFKNVSYEINRMNQFAKTLALFKWAKQKGGTLITLPKNVEYVVAPNTISYGIDSISSYSDLEVKNIFDSFKKKWTSLITNKIEILNNKEANDTHETFIKNFDQVNTNVSTTWYFLINKALRNSEKCDIKFPKNDHYYDLVKIAKDYTEDEYIRIGYLYLIEFLIQERLLIQYIHDRNCNGLEEN